MLISKNIPPGFVGGTSQWVKESVFARMRISVDFDTKKKFDKIALVSEGEERFTQGKEHSLIQIYALIEHDHDNYKLVEIMEAAPMPITQSLLMTLEKPEIDTINVYMEVSRFKKRVYFESDSTLLLYFVLGVKN